MSRKNKNMRQKIKGGRRARRAPNPVEVEPGSIWHPQSTWYPVVATASRVYDVEIAILILVYVILGSLLRVHPGPDMILDLNIELAIRRLRRDYRQIIALILSVCFFHWFFTYTIGTPLGSHRDEEIPD